MFSNMKIRIRMILGFGLVLLLILAMGIFAYYQLNTMAGLTKQLYASSLPVSVAVNKLKTSFTSIELLMSQAIGSRTKVNTQELNKRYLMSISLLNFNSMFSEKNISETRKKSRR